MIKKVQRYLHKVSNFICYIKSGNFDKDRVDLDDEIHFTEHTIFVAPVIPCFDLLRVNQNENQLIEELSRTIGKRILFNPTNIGMEHWFFGFGYVMRKKNRVPRFRSVGKPINYEKHMISTDILIYPHRDLARTALLYSFNKNAIDLCELEYYKEDNGHETVIQA